MTRGRRGSSERSLPDSATASLPAGWTHCALSAVTVDVESIRPELQPERLWRYADIGAIDPTTNEIRIAKTFRGADAPSRARRPVEVGDVLFSNVRVNLRKIAFVQDPKPADVCSTGFTVLRTNGALHPRYLLHAVLRDDFIQAIEETQTGTQYPATSERLVRAGSIPIPPFAEQLRISQKLDALTSRLRTTRERLSRIPDVLSRFREASLLAGCLGDLSSEWRRAVPSGDSVKDLQAARGRAVSEADSSPGRRKKPFWSNWEVASLDDERILPPGWAWVHAGAAYAAAGYGTSARSERDRQDGVPVVGVPNITSGRLDPRGAKYSTLSAGELGDLILRQGDVVVCRTNGSLALVGKAAVVPPLPRPHAFASYLIRIRTLSGALLPEYLHAVLSSPIGRGQIEAVARSSAGQFNLSLGFLGSLALPLPPVAEQREIVRRLDALLHLADEVERRTLAAEAKGSEVTRSVVAAAFSGKLLPTEAELAREEGREFEDGAALVLRIASQRGVPAQRYEPRGQTGGGSVVGEGGPMKNLDAIGKTYLRDILRNHKTGMTPEELFAAADLEVDDFYTQLKREVVARGVQQRRKDKQTVLLEAAR